MYKLVCWNLNHLFWAFFQSLMIMIFWSWNLFQSQCQCQSHLHTIFLLGWFFHCSIKQAFHDLFFLLLCKGGTHYRALDRLFKKNKDKVHACRLVWESNKISCTDFPPWRHCFSNCNIMPKRFQTRSLGECHQNLWPTEHRLWI